MGQQTGYKTLIGMHSSKLRSCNYNLLDRSLVHAQHVEANKIIMQLYCGEDGHVTPLDQNHKRATPSNNNVHVDKIFIKPIQQPEAL
jgi:hypothetical protein